jgi:hypothetical protein
MAKYYVESGDYRVVVQARGPIPAAARALSWATPEDTLDQVVTVNERGFISDLKENSLGRSIVVVETGTLMSLLQEHELN